MLYKITVEANAQSKRKEFIIARDIVCDRCVETGRFGRININFQITFALLYHYYYVAYYFGKKIVASKGLLRSTFV